MNEAKSAKGILRENLLIHFKKRFLIRRRGFEMTILNFLDNIQKYHRVKTNRFNGLKMFADRSVNLSIIIFFFLILPRQESSAQINFSLNVTSMYDDNSFSFYDKRADVYHQIFFNVTKDFEGDYSNLSLYSYNAGVIFRTYDTRRYTQHTLGALYTLQLDHRDGDSDDEDTTEVEEEEMNDTSSKNHSEEDSTEVDSTKSAEQTDNGEELINEDDLSVSYTIDSTETQILIEEEKKTPQIDSTGNHNIQAITAPKTVESTNDSLVTYLHIQPSINGRFDRAEFDFYDSKSATMNTLLRYHLFGSLISRLQYEVEFKSIPNLQQFTHVEHNALITLSSIILTKSELYGSINYGYKAYTYSFSDTTIIGGGNSGKGKGKGSVKPPQKLISQISTPSTSQLVLALGFVQRLEDKSHFILSYIKRINPTNKARFIDTRELIGLSEDQIFDDRYGYQSNELHLNIDAQIFRYLHLTSVIQYEWKSYARVATDITGNKLQSEPQRRDRRFDAEFQLLYPVLKNSAGAASLSLGGVYQFHRNLSNDQYHDYHIHQAAIVLEAEF